MENGKVRTFQRAAHAVSATLENEGVILDLASGVYSGLNKVGNDIWNLLETPRSLEEIVGALCEKYDVGHRHCRTSVENFLKKLVDEGVVVVSGKADR